MKEVARKFQGVFAFLVTPTTSDGDAIDLDRLRRFIDLQVEAGVDGITVFGSTGGIGSFTEDERRQVIETAAKHIDGRVPLVAGTGSMQTSEAVRLSKFAQDVGADAVLVVPITYWPLTEDEVLGHFEAIAAATSLPVGLYNNPWTTGVDVVPAEIARIAQIDTVGFVKESSGDMTRVPAIKNLTGGAVTVLNGWDACTPAAIGSGVDGWFAGSCSIMPEHCVELFRLGHAVGDLAAANALFQRMYPICELMGQKSYIRVAYTACELLGRDMGQPRRPLRGLGDDDRRKLASLLEALGPARAA